MRTRPWLSLVATACACAAAFADPEPVRPVAPRAASAFALRPSFLENRGQFARKDALFYTTSTGVEVAFCPGVVLFNHLRWERRDDWWCHVGGDLVELRVSDGDVVPQAGERAPGLSHFLLGEDRSKWVRGVRHFSRVHYADVRPGIDLDWSFDARGELTYEFTVHPGADPRDIALAYRGVSGIERLGPAAVDVVHSGTRMRDGDLVSFQVVDGARRVVPSEFRMLGADAYGFDLPKGYDPTRDLVVDPTLKFLSYWGYSTGDHRTVSIDTSGNIYLSGGADTPGWPTTPGAYDRTHSGNGWPDATCAKFDSSGNLVWATLLGGPNEDYCYVSAVNGSGELYISGRAGDGFPTTPGAFDRTFNGGIGAPGVHSPTDAFVTKVKSDGSDLIYSTYIGGNGDDNGRAIHLFADGRLVVGSGNTKSTNLPTTQGALKPSLGGNQDSWIGEVTADGSSLVFCTYFGPNNDFSDNTDETMRSLAVDDVGNIWAAGDTGGTDMTPTANAFQKVRGGTLNMPEAWVAKISPDGRELRYFSWLGGSAEEEVETEGVNDAAGNFYFAGDTASADFPFTPGAFRSTVGGRGAPFAGDGYVVKVNADGSLGMATAYGGSTLGPETCFGPAVDALGNVYVTGRVRSTDVPVTSDAFQPAKATGADKDAFLAVFSNDGKRLLFGSYLGGTGDDEGRHIAIHPDGSFVVILGQTESTDLAVVNAYQTTPSGVFFAKVDVSDLSGAGGTPGAFRFSQAAYSAGEASGTATITVERTGGSKGAASVGYAVTAGSATAGSDFDVASGTLQFADGVTHATFDVTIHDDQTAESDETVSLTLQSPGGGASLGSPNHASLTIVDDDGSRSESPLLNPSVAALRRSAGHPERDRFSLTGVIDTGLTTLDLTAPVTARIGGVVFDAAAPARRHGTYVVRDSDLEVAVQPSRAGSSRAVLNVVAKGAALEALDPLAPVVVEFQCGAFHAACKVQLAAGRFRDRGRAGVRLAPMAAPISMKGVVRGGGKDSLNLTIALPPDADVSADLTLDVGTLTLSAPAAQFKVRHGLKTFATRTPRPLTVVLDPAERTVSVKASGVDLGAAAGSPLPLLVELTLGTTHGFDVRVARHGARIAY